MSADAVETTPPSRLLGRLWRENGRVLYQSEAEGEAVAVRLLWARPLSQRNGDGPISVMLAEKKKEVAYAPCLDAFPPNSRDLAREELAESMILPRITHIREVKPRFGNYYWAVETDHGSRRFLFTAPENNTFRPGPDTLVVKDVSGNCFEITSVSQLDEASRMELDRVL